MNKELRYYQIEAKEAVNNALKRGITRQLLVMPGGTGKTRTAVDIVKDMGRKLWITHEESLLEQSAIALLEELDLMPLQSLKQTIDNNGGLINLLREHNIFHGEFERLIIDNIGIIKADLFIIDKPIVMASAQTLYKKLDQIPQDYFNAIIADEGDLFGSKTFQEPLSYFKFGLLLGLTATPFRADNMLIGDIFSEIVYEYKIEQAIKDKFLTKLEAYRIKTNISLDKVHTVAGDFNKQELVDTVNTPERNNLIVDKYIQYASGQQFICFGVDVQHVIDLHEAFRAKGIHTEYVVSDKSLITDEERKRITRGYKSGEIIGLVNFMIFAVGFDHPNTGCVILGCPTKSRRKFLQQLFRVTRLKDLDFVSKFGQRGIILDIVDGTSRHKLINTEELDSDKELEDKIFMPEEHRQRILEARNQRQMKMDLKARDEDEKVQLFPLPKMRIRKSIKMEEPATPGQLISIERFGYPVDDVNYTKMMIADIFAAQPACMQDVENLKSCGYDVSKGVTVFEVQLAHKEIAIRDARANTLRLKKEGKL